MFELHLATVSVSCEPIVLQFILRIFSVLMSGMPKRACHFPETTNKLQIFSLLLWSILPFLYLIVLLLFSYVLVGLFVSLVAANCSFLALGNNFLYICNGIIFSSLSVSTLYVTGYYNFVWWCFQICCYYGMVVIKNNGNYIHHVSVIVFFLVRFLLYLVDCSAFCTPANLSEVVHLVALHLFISICWASSGSMAWPQ